MKGCASHVNDGAGHQHDHKPKLLTPAYPVTPRSGHTRPASQITPAPYKIILAGNAPPVIAVLTVPPCTKHNGTRNASTYQTVSWNALDEHHQKPTHTTWHDDPTGKHSDKKSEQQHDHYSNSDPKTV